MWKLFCRQRHSDYSYDVSKHRGVLCTACGGTPLIVVMCGVWMWKLFCRQRHSDYSYDRHSDYSYDVSKHRGVLCTAYGGDPLMVVMCGVLMWKLSPNSEITITHMTLRWRSVDDCCYVRSVDVEVVLPTAT
ncbi:hypothetical protein J6590_100143 [Homalodisca vitripennis]|nr:hypothetical protein J6590_100143 [Homalodisca vitripennis]